MNSVELTEFLVKNLVKKSDMISVKQFSDDDDVAVIEVWVDNSLMPALILRKRNIAKAIRTLVQAQAYQNNEKKVRIDIDSF